VPRNLHVLQFDSGRVSELDEAKFAVSTKAAFFPGYTEYLSGPSLARGSGRGRVDAEGLVRSIRQAGGYAELRDKTDRRVFRPSLRRN